MNHPITHRTDTRRVARGVAELERGLDIEARVLDPTGNGRCSKLTCSACRFETFGARATLEGLSACPKCSSHDVAIVETSYPRHTATTLSYHVARNLRVSSHRARALVTTYLRRRATRMACRPRAPSRQRTRRCRVQRRAAKSRDGDPEPAPRRRASRSSVGGVA